MDLDPPPTYSEKALAQPRDSDRIRPLEIRRKPITPGLRTVSAGSPAIKVTTEHNEVIHKTRSTQGLRNFDGEVETSTSICAQSYNAYQETPTTSRIPFPHAASASQLSRVPTSSSALTTFENIAPADTITSQPSSAPSSPSFVSKAFEEARHFAGGLIAHPSESTRHFSILRHSHGLVFYQGCETTLAVSIFSDAPLPVDRQIWLQDKGWSGKTGMRVKAFIGNNGNWLNVTPTTPVSAEQLNASDERAWQRDIKKFLKKTKYPKHVLRETLVVRIPVEASDGYFQLVLCPGEKKKVLCPSPVFRVLSASSSPSSLRGASLSTLPLELGALALTTYASNTIGRVISPATTAAQTAVKPFMPSSQKIEAATMLYSTTGTQDMVSTTIQNGNVEYHGARNVMPMHAGAGLESGPVPPYPIYFAARAEIPTDGDYFGMPTMNLTGVSEHIDHQLRGHYFAWARVHGSTRNVNPPLENGSWSQTVVSSVQVRAADIPRASITQASKKAFKIHFISDGFEARLYAGMKLDIKIMGFLRADGSAAPSDFEQELVASLNDIIYAQRLLSEPAFAPEMDVSDQPRRGVLERASTSYAATRLAAQRQLDKVPLHRMGLRMDVDRMRDKAIGVNGFYVRR
jgi:hypothetical protein